MNLLSGLEKFGFQQLNTENLFEDEKKEEDGQDNALLDKKKEEHTEVEFLLDKSVRCPVCDRTFKTRMVKNGRVRRLEPDFDLRPRFQHIDTIKYDVCSCPSCGYTAMNRYFSNLSAGQIKLLEEGVRKQFKSPLVIQDEPMEAYSYEKAIERYKLALYSTLVKKGKTSEKAYECLKISWLYRGWQEEMAASEQQDEQIVEEYHKEEILYYEQAYEGFLKAIVTENYPMCGMDESTVNLLVAHMAFRLEHMDVASRFVAFVLTSQVSSRAAKERALELKDEIIKKLHNSRE